MFSIHDCNFLLFFQVLQVEGDKLSPSAATMTVDDNNATECEIMDKDSETLNFK